MILEVAIFDVTSGREADFEAAFAEAWQILAAQRGHITHTMQRCMV